MELAYCRLCIIFIHLIYVLMSAAVKSDPALWKRIVAEVKTGTVAGPSNTWNARKAQLAVSRYKRAGGKYKSPRDGTSLAEWTDADWGYIDGKPGNRYLPAVVRDALSPAEAAVENRRKKAATRRGKSRASYSEKVKELLRKSRRSRKSKSRKSKSRKSRPRGSK